MTKRRRRKRKAPAFNIDLDDIRIQRIMAISLIFLAGYLFIAFISYLFTWHIDQDKVLDFSWVALLSNEHEMANWIGNLGAVVSNMFFYWGIGLSSFIVPVIFAYWGLRRLQPSKFEKRENLESYLVAGGIVTAVFLEYVFSGASFSWGGAVGEVICNWMYSFLGGVGLFAFFVFIAIVSVIWFLNPEWHDLKYFDFRIFRKKAQTSESTVVAVPQSGGNSFSTNSPFEKVESKEGFSEVRYNPAMEGEVVQLENERQLEFKVEEAAKKRAKLVKKEPQETKLEIKDTLQGESGPSEDADPPPMDNEITQENSTETEPYDPTMDLSNFKNPTADLLDDYNEQKIEVDRKELEANKDQIINTLRNYKIEITKIRATIGPTVTLYEIVPAPGVRISKIKNLEDDIALSLAALGIRIIAPIPGKGTIGIEVPNKKKQIVSLKEVLASEKFQNAKMDLPLGLGKTISNDVFIADLAKMPHLLIAGATGQGKSVGINTILTSLLFKKHPSQIKLVLIDPKKVELFPYVKLVKHYLAYLPGLDEPIVTDTTKVVHTFNSLLIEMDERYNLLKKARARNIKEYNDKFVSRKLNPNNGHKFMPYIILVIDEFADLIMTAGKEIELPIARLAQLSRAVGIHLIIATQRPSVNIITGVIKANFPARIGFKVTAKVDSRTILDTGGADRLIGRGDMLLSYGSDLIRLQCAFIDTPEVERVIDFIDEQQSYPIPYLLPEYSGDEDKIGGGFNVNEIDSNFVDAARLVVQNQHGSTSMIQRRLKLGYNRAGRIMDQLEAAGIVGGSAGSKPREVFMHDEVELERYLEDLAIRK
ncbi:MAG: DNA translocase FtsK [Bacteroidia bacterium]|nr:DNA translocase FtsK [Bacteroidia bacterium]